MKKNILIVDDDKRLRELLKDFLTDKKFQIFLCQDFFEAKEILTFIYFDLIILDRMMPSGDGIDLIEFIKTNSNSPIIMLTAMGENKNKIDGLKIGADDYLSKPFEPEELYLRIKKLLNLYRGLSGESVKVSFGNFVYDMSSLELKNNNELVYLTESENELLIKLIFKRNDIVLREELADQEFDETELRKVDVRITRLRQKIEINAKQPQFIKTVRGKGYKLICNEF
ncbi:response regulator transcription factor [Pelagibacteraceae bacterium]|nr:response regulator transcription factor [Pelagibacteraceae bacterium]